MASNIQQGRRRAARALVVLAALALVAALWPDAASLYDLTGEEQPRGQLAGIAHWINTAIRPQPDLQPAAVAGSPHAFPAVSAFGVNTFLQQEAEEAKRAQSLDLTRAAGLRFVRQEFTWEDIEIHAKGDFIDRRNDPAGVDA